MTLSSTNVMATFWFQQQGSGLAETEQEEGHTGADSTNVTRGQSQQQQQRPNKRKPGKSSQDRSLANESSAKKLQTIDNESQQDGPNEESQVGSL